MSDKYGYSGSNNLSSSSSSTPSTHKDNPKPGLPGYYHGHDGTPSQHQTTVSTSRESSQSKKDNSGSNIDTETVPVAHSDSLLGKTVRFAKDNYTIKGLFVCQGEELCALECERPLSGYNGLCPRCNRQHVQLSYTRGYYTSVQSVYDAMEREELQNRRKRGPKPINELNRIEKNLPPLDEPITGKNKGIEGDSNSCYMDATIFCLFAYVNVFDSLLHTKITYESTKILQKLLKENIVNVLRSETGFVERDALWHLRFRLSEAANDPSFIEMEKDPSEFLRAIETLFQYAPLKTIPSNQPLNENLSNITTNIIWEMFDDNPRNLSVTKIASLFRNSLSEMQVKLATIPPFLILVAPRHTRSQRSYRYIIPDRRIALDNNIVQLVCLKCKKTNHDPDSTNDFIACEECFTKDNAALCSPPGTIDTRVICYCAACAVDAHKMLSPEERSNHNCRKIEMNEHKLDLFAVLCIETSHYVAFVKCKRRDRQAEWLFFDSMSDRIHNEKNIARVDAVPKFEEWIDRGEKNKSFFEDLDNLRTQQRPSAYKNDENTVRMLRLFRDGAFFFYENISANYR